jgi:twitching motility protein PilT
MLDIEAALRMLVERDGSDLHVKVGAPPMARINGELEPLFDREPLKPDETEGALDVVLQDAKLRQSFGETGEADFAYAIPGVSRFRMNAFRQRGSISIVSRAIPYSVRTIEELGLPEVVRTLAEEQRGIILVTGTTGSGKSTTLAAMIDHINTNWPRHIVTMEDPIEYLHRDNRSIVNQREVGADTESFGRAMRRVLRQDPDVILIGEMRDEETVRTALSAAETGHLVLSTVHTLDATETINRIIDFFPPHLQHQARVMLAATLRGAIAQRLIPDVTGNGRVAAAEIMVSTGRIQDLIMNPDETSKITEVISEGEYYGMQTFDQALLKYVMEGRVSEEVALQAASSPHDFKLMLAAGGQRASGIEQLSGNGSGNGAPAKESSASHGTVSNGQPAAPAVAAPPPPAPPAPPAPATPASTASAPPAPPPSTAPPAASPPPSPAPPAASPPPAPAPATAPPAAPAPPAESGPPPSAPPPSGPPPSH